MSNERESEDRPSESGGGGRGGVHLVTDRVAGHGSARPPCRSDRDRVRSIDMVHISINVTRPSHFFKPTRPPHTTTGASSCSQPQAFFNSPPPARLALSTMRTVTALVAALGVLVHQASAFMPPAPAGLRGESNMQCGPARPVGRFHACTASCVYIYG